MLFLNFVEVDVLEVAGGGPFFGIFAGLVIGFFFAGVVVRDVNLVAFDFFNPDDVAVGARVTDADGADFWRVADRDAVASGGRSPLIGVAAAAEVWHVAVGILDTPRSVADTFANIHAVFVEFGIFVLRAAILVRVATLRAGWLSFGSFGRFWVGLDWIFDGAVVDMTFDGLCRLFFFWLFGLWFGWGL